MVQNLLSVVTRISLTVSETVFIEQCLFWTINVYLSQQFSSYSWPPHPGNIAWVQRHMGAARNIVPAAFRLPTTPCLCNTPLLDRNSADVNYCTREDLIEIHINMIQTVNHKRLNWLLLLSCHRHSDLIKLYKILNNHSYKIWIDNCLFY